MAGLLSLLRCREGEIVGGAATAAVWALCRAPENRKAFAKIRFVCVRRWRLNFVMQCATWHG